MRDWSRPRSVISSNTTSPPASSTPSVTSHCSRHPSIPPFMSVSSAVVRSPDVPHKHLAPCLCCSCISASFKSRRRLLPVSSMVSTRGEAYRAQYVVDPLHLGSTHSSSNTDGSVAFVSASSSPQLGSPGFNSPLPPQVSRHACRPRAWRTYIPTAARVRCSPRANRICNACSGRI